MIDIKDRYKRFLEWKLQPHQVAPLSEEAHECPTCGTNYQGNYCPRCGQSARIGRYSLKKALLLFLDVWGMGNRGMFRTLRDLLLRPGYMIRDYLHGMQMAYFPPFKMFFLLIALSLLIDTGLNVRGVNRMRENSKKTEQFFQDFSSENHQTEAQEKNASASPDQKVSAEELRRDKLVEEAVGRKMNLLAEWGEQHTSMVLLVSLLFFTLPLWFLIRHSPAIPDLRLSECFVAMVYITNMITIYDFIPSLLCFSLKTELLYSLFALLLAIIPIKQLSGYSYPTTIWRVLAAFILFLVFFILMTAAISMGMYLYYRMTIH